MSMFKRRRREVPGLNTASLPDLIFTVLFFFMIVTHMRKTTPMVRSEVPRGTELSAVKDKSTVTYIYIGKPIGGKSDSVCVQVDDRYVTPEELTRYLQALRRGMDKAERDRMSILIRADRHVKMGLITDVKMALRRAGALKISYAAADSVP